MADLQVTNSFVDGDTVSATNFNTNYSDIVTYINNRNSASASWDAMYCTHSTNVPLIANNSTGTQDIIQCKDNGTTVFSVNDGGYVNAPSQFYARMHFSTSQAAANNADAKITFDTGTQSVQAIASNGTFTVPVNGKYIFICCLHFNQNLGSGSEVIIPGIVLYKNGAAFSRRTQTTSFTGFGSVWFMDTVNLSATDTVEIYQTNSGRAAGGSSLISSSTKNFLSIVKLS